jgi:hypothetical protein
MVWIGDPNGRAGDVIVYTTDGSTPTASSAVYTGPGPLTVTTYGTLNAVVLNPACAPSACKTGYAPSPVTTFAYTVDSGAMDAAAE